MNNKNTIRRDYLIIRRIMRGDYPSASVLLQYLERNDIAITLRTLQRDMADIRSNLDIEVIYDSKKNGYCIDETCSMDMDKLLYFLGLAESSDVILSNIKDRQKLLKYLSISPNPHAKGVENIGILLQAVQQCTVININHLSYQTGEQTTYTVEPYLLKEFEGMWYLFAYCEDMGVFRTFGLDRIGQIQITDRTFQRREELERTAEKFDKVYGLVYEPDNNPNAPIEEVRLKASAFMLPYIQSLPIHSSQSIDGDTITLHLIINPELENRIMGYGEHIEVLSPPLLRKRIKERIMQSLSRYDD
ncbi:WYL domain-containing protein [Bacteroides clarus]|uniref:helix-turn-helix transcriptional regulator n=1 Tax=Bacteroides clarus TaxID=626929 RepID=UPI0021016A20|nr:WYL domain-containing protein [Bacteroides clarus]MCQ1545168.1 WYL domain-containing protein [Bacteroides clarus]